MTRVRKAATITVVTPLAAAAIAIGVGAPAHAESGCWPFSSASITPVTGKIVAGQTVHAQATVKNMLFKAHLQISGPGLSQKIGQSAYNGTIGGDVTVTKAGYFTLSVVGDGSGCTYDTSGFSVKVKPSPKPSHRSSSKVPTPAGLKAPNVPGSVPSGTGPTYGLTPLNSSSPFSLPSVAPDQGIQFPTAEPQVASPPVSQPQARDVAVQTPIKWGQSIAIALVLLLLSAHLGMWSRRQRLAAAGGARTVRGSGRSPRLGRARATKASDKGSDKGSDVTTASAVAVTEHGRSALTAGRPVTGTSETDELPRVSLIADDTATHAAKTEDTDIDAAWLDEPGRRPSGRGYRGRRRRG